MLILVIITVSRLIELDSVECIGYRARVIRVELPELPSPQRLYL